MTEITPEANEEFVRKVKELLEAITRKPYLVAEKQQLEKSIWAVYLDEDKIKIGENQGAYWVQEEKDGTIRIYSDQFYDVDDVASEEYNAHFLIEDDLLEKKNWEKYRKKVPGLIAELEAAEKTADEANKKYGTNIKLWARQKPLFETSFNAKGMSEDEKLHEIEKHARAMLESWELWREWAKDAGREIYMKTSKRRLSKAELVDDIITRLHDITKAVYTYGNKKPGIRWIVVGSYTFKENLAANRGAWLIKETKDSIVIMSDNLETINARSIDEYRMIQQRRERGIATQEDRFKEIAISPELIEKVVEQVSDEFKVKIRIRKDRPIMMTTFHTNKLRPYGKLYEIEKHAKALAEAWNRIKNGKSDSQQTLNRGSENAKDSNRSAPSNGSKGGPIPI